MDEVFERVGIDRKEIYLTNAVKHFKWEGRGKRRDLANAYALVESR